MKLKWNMPKFEYSVK